MVGFCLFQRVDKLVDTLSDFEKGRYVRTPKTRQARFGEPRRFREKTP